MATTQELTEADIAEQFNRMLTSYSGQRWIPLMSGSMVRNVTNRALIVDMGMSDELTETFTKLRSLVPREPEKKVRVLVSIHTAVTLRSHAIIFLSCLKQLAFRTGPSLLIVPKGIDRTYLPKRFRTATNVLDYLTIQLSRHESQLHPDMDGEVIMTNARNTLSARISDGDHRPFKNRSTLSLPDYMIYEVDSDDQHSFTINELVKILHGSQQVRREGGVLRLPLIKLQIMSMTPVDAIDLTTYYDDDDRVVTFNGQSVQILCTPYSLARNYKKLMNASKTLDRFRVECGKLVDSPELFKFIYTIAIDGDPIMLDFINANGDKLDIIREESDPSDLMRYLWTLGPLRRRLITLMQRLTNMTFVERDIVHLVARGNSGGPPRLLLTTTQY